MMAAIISFLGPLDAEERQSWLNRHCFLLAPKKLNKNTFFREKVKKQNKKHGDFLGALDCRRIPRKYLASSFVQVCA